MTKIISDVSKKAIPNAMFGKTYTTILGLNLTIEEDEELKAKVRKIMRGKDKYTLKEYREVFTKELHKACQTK